MYDLLTSPECLPDLLQGGLAEQGVNEAFILTTFKLQPKMGATVFGFYNPRDNSKYFEFTILGKLNRGESQDVRLVVFVETDLNCVLLYFLCEILPNVILSLESTSQTSPGGAIV